MSSVAHATQIMTHVERRAPRRRVRRGVERAANALVAAARRYRGGTAAERDSHRALAAQLKHELRSAHLSGLGRRIDLLALLNEQREVEGRLQPVWALVDPRQPIGPGNESHAHREAERAAGWSEPQVSWIPMGDGRYAKGISVGGAAVPVQYDCTVRHDSAMSGYQSMRVTGIPALPARVRELLSRPALRQARMVGLLYQPAEWQQVRPDPALVVEWTDLPGEYYALAVWGGDRARIMEFVD